MSIRTTLLHGAVNDAVNALRKIEPIDPYTEEEEALLAEIEFNLQEGIDAMNALLGLLREKI